MWWSRLGQPEKDNLTPSSFYLRAPDIYSMNESFEYDSVDELHQYFDSILKKKQSKPCIANEVRDFVETYAEKIHDTRLAVYILYNVFQVRRPDITIDKPYFEYIVTKAWHSYELDDTLHIDVKRPIINRRNMRRRRF